MTPWRPHSVPPASRLSIPYAVPPFEAEFQIQVLSDQVLDVYVRDNPMMEQGETLGVSVGVMQHDLLMRFHPFVRVWYLLIQNSGTVEAHIQYLVKWGEDVTTIRKRKGTAKWHTLSNTGTARRA